MLRDLTSSERNGERRRRGCACGSDSGRVLLRRSSLRHHCSKASSISTRSTTTEFGTTSASCLASPVSSVAASRLRVGSKSRQGVLDKRGQLALPGLGFIFALGDSLAGHFGCLRLRGVPESKTLFDRASHLLRAFSVRAGAPFYFSENSCLSGGGQRQRDSSQTKSGCIISTPRRSGARSRRSKRVVLKRMQSLVVNLDRDQKTLPGLVLDSSKEGYRLRGGFHLRRAQFIEIVFAPEPSVP